MEMLQRSKTRQNDQNHITFGCWLRRDRAVSNGWSWRRSGPHQCTRYPEAEVHVNHTHTHTQMEDSLTPYPRYTAPNGEKVSIAGTPESRFIVWTQAARRMKATTTLTAPPVPKRTRIPSQIWGYLMGVFGPRAYQVSGMCIPMEDAKPPMKNRKE